MTIIIKVQKLVPETISKEEYFGLLKIVQEAPKYEIFDAVDFESDWNKEIMQGVVVGVQLPLDGTEPIYSIAHLNGKQRVTDEITQSKVLNIIHI